GEPPLLLYRSFFCQSACPSLDLHSFPTRRSSDLVATTEFLRLFGLRGRIGHEKLLQGLTVTSAEPGKALLELGRIARRSMRLRRDRKSTRLNSSHVKISYAVFCLKKKNN